MMSVPFHIKLKNFFKSLWFHIVAGLPKCTQEQINFRFSICKNECEWYNKEDSSCLQCGCNVSEKKIFMNKLAWADQQCPVDKWQKVNK